ASNLRGARAVGSARRLRPVACGCYAARRLSVIALELAALSRVHSTTRRSRRPPRPPFTAVPAAHRKQPAEDHDIERRRITPIESDRAEARWPCPAAY